MHQRGRFIDGKGCLAYFIISSVSSYTFDQVASPSGPLKGIGNMYMQHTLDLIADLQQHDLMGAIRMPINIGYMLASLRDAKPRQY